MVEDCACRGEGRCRGSSRLPPCTLLLLLLPAATLLLPSLQSTFLWVYVDVLHLPGLPFHDSLGDGVIYSLVAAVLLLGIGWTATRMLATRQQRYKRLVEDAIAEEVDQLAAVVTGSDGGGDVAAASDSGGAATTTDASASPGATGAADAAAAALP